MQILPYNQEKPSYPENKDICHQYHHDDRLLLFPDLLFVHHQDDALHLLGALYILLYGPKSSVKIAVKIRD